MAAINRVGNNPSVLFCDFFDPHNLYPISVWLVLLISTKINNLNLESYTISTPVHYFLENALAKAR